MKKHFYGMMALTFAAALCCGCSSDKPEPPQEYCSIPMYMAGQEIPSESQEKIMFNPTIKMYSVGRRLDPVTGTMNEASTFYRMEQEPEWNLVPQYDMNHETFARQMKQEAYADIIAGQVKSSLYHTQSVSSQLKTLEAEIVMLSEDKRILLGELAKREAEVKKLTENMRQLRDYISTVDSKVSNIKIHQKKKELAEGKAEEPKEDVEPLPPPPAGSDIMQRRRLQ